MNEKTFEVDGVTYSILSDDTVEIISMAPDELWDMRGDPMYEMDCFPSNETVEYGKRIYRIVGLGANTLDNQNKDFDYILLNDCITNIDPKIFNRCHQLRYIYCLSTTPPTLKGMTTQKWVKNELAMTIYVPEGCVDAYKNAEGWKLFTDIVEYDFDDGYTAGKSIEEKRFEEGDIEFEWRTNHTVTQWCLLETDWDVYDFNNVCSKPITAIYGGNFCDLGCPEEIDIPATVTHIQIGDLDNTFYGLHGCNIYFYSEVPPRICDVGGDDDETYSWTTDCNIYVPKGSLKKYRTKPFWQDIKNIQEF